MATWVKQRLSGGDGSDHLHMVPPDNGLNQFLPAFVHCILGCVVFGVFLVVCWFYVEDNLGNSVLVIKAG